MRDLRRTIILGSRSPRRRELLGQLIGSDRIAVVTPRFETEPGFEGLRDLEAIDDRLLHIAGLKHDDVCAQVSVERESAAGSIPIVVAADTVIVGLEASGEPVVLGKPPEDDPRCAATVRLWFESYFAGRWHLAKTAVCVGPPGGARQEAVVTTEVLFRRDAARFLDWYIATGEPRGKAGGYAIQGAGSLFVEGIRGGLSNVVGLPLVEVREMLDRVTSEPG